ncbi:alcohol dehydrogenase catalytic domain-containing protein [bacterium]|nr:alcohol dehydrogenase catalytic domain-containing protein [bacterium]
MKRITWTGNDTLVYTEDAPLPAPPGREEVLVRVTAVGLCGTDVHIVSGRTRFTDPPHVLGHEIAGVVEETGDAVECPAGTRVTIDSVVGCGECVFCHRGATQFCPNGYEIGQTVTGGMQEFITVPARNAIPVPDGIGDEVAAILDPEVLGALVKPGVCAGETFLVIGPGPAGLIAVQIGKILGAGTTILMGTRPERLKLGAQLGADITINPAVQNPREVVNDVTKGRGAGLVFDGAGTSSSLASALDLVSVQGRVVLYGVHGSPVPTVNIDIITLKDLTVYGALSDRVGWERLFGWLLDGSLDLASIITHRFPFSEAQQAYECVRDRRDGAIKAVLFPA